MRDQINLASQKVNTKKNVRKVFLISLAVFSLSFTASAILLLITLFQNNDLNALSSERSQLESSITSQNDTVKNALILKDRLSAISKIISTRFDLNTKLTTYLSLLPTSLAVKGIEMSRDKIALTLTSTELSEFDSLLDEKLINLDPKNYKDVKRIDMTAFHVDKKTGIYSLTLTFNLNEHTVK